MNFVFFEEEKGKLFSLYQIYILFLENFQAI